MEERLFPVAIRQGFNDHRNVEARLPIAHITMAGLMFQVQLQSLADFRFLICAMCGEALERDSGKGHHVALELRRQIEFFSGMLNDKRIHR